MAQIKIIVNGKECFGEAGKTILAIAAENGIEIDLNSVVQAQFGDEILAVVREVLAECGVENAHVSVQDRGALDCVIRARVETAINRGKGEE